MKRILLVLTVALMMAAMMAAMVAPAFAKHAQTFSHGQTATYQGNSTNSPQISCHHGSPGSNGSPC